jgi:pilus assembly protein Flp/PilA
MRRVFQRFVDDETGATAIEYGLLGMLIGVGAIVAFTTLGNNLEALFGTSESGISTVLEAAVNANDPQPQPQE